MIIPIFIHVHEKSDKEIREEMERERRWHDAVKREEERKRFENPWDYSFLPEGWCIFGTPLKIVEEI